MPPNLGLGVGCLGCQLEDGNQEYKMVAGWVDFGVKFIRDPICDSYFPLGG